MHLLELAIHWNNEGALLLSSNQLEAGEARMEQSLCALRSLLGQHRCDAVQESSDEPRAVEPSYQPPLETVQFFWTPRMQDSMLHQHDDFHEGTTDRSKHYQRFQHSSRHESKHGTDLASASSSISDALSPHEEDGRVFIIDQPLQFAVPSYLSQYRGRDAGVDADTGTIVDRQPAKDTENRLPRLHLDNALLTLYSAGVIFNLALAHHRTNPGKSRALYTLMYRCFPVINAAHAASLGLDDATYDGHVEQALALEVVATNNLAALECNGFVASSADDIEQHWHQMGEYLYMLQEHHRYSFHQHQSAVAQNAGVMHYDVHGQPSMHQNVLQQCLGEKLYEQLLLNVFLCPTSRHFTAGAA